MRARFRTTYLNVAKYDAASFVVHLMGRQEWAAKFSEDADAIRKVMRVKAEETNAS